MDIRAKAVVFVQGFFVGTADIIPGVSGGTMAFILGIYSRLINAIRSFDLVWLNSVLRCEFKAAVNRPDLAFLLPFAVGILGALFFFTRVLPLPQLLLTVPELIYGLFFGLVAGSVWVLFSAAGRPGLRLSITLAAGLISGLVIVELVAFNTTDAYWFIMVCGLLATMAMLLPGISGALVLLVLNKYGYILDAVVRVDFAVILPFLFGVLVGLVFFSRILSWLLKYYYRQTVFLMLGFLLASLRVLWPFQQRGSGGQERGPTSFFSLSDSSLAIPAIAMMLLGLFIALLLNIRARRGNSLSL